MNISFIGALIIIRTTVRVAVNRWCAHWFGYLPRLVSGFRSVKGAYIFTLFVGIKQGWLKRPVVGQTVERCEMEISCPVVATTNLQMFSVTERKPAFTSLKVNYEPRTLDIYYLCMYLKSILYLLSMTSTWGLYVLVFVHSHVCTK